MSRTFTDNINSFNVSNNIIVTAADDKSKILAWLPPLEPQVRHQDICQQRVDGIGGWLLETEEFINWYRGSNHTALFCYGNPGVGKSYICSVVVDYLCDQVGGQDMAVACFYYDFASREAHSPAGMLGYLLRQLLSGLEAIPGEIREKFRGQRKLLGGRRPQLPDIVKMFATVSSLQQTFICVDALDECTPEHQLEVLGALGQILQRSPNMRIFMTGRSHIQKVVERALDERVISISITVGSGDIAMYLQARLGKDITPEVMDSGLKCDIMKCIPEEVSESYVAIPIGFTQNRGNPERSDNPPAAEEALFSRRWVRVGRCIRGNTGTDKSSRRGESNTCHDYVNVDMSFGKAITGR